MKIDDYKYAIGQRDVLPERRSQLESCRAKRRNGRIRVMCSYGMGVVR